MQMIGVTALAIDINGHGAGSLLEIRKNVDDLIKE